jgi:hypothetical protein
MHISCLLTEDDMLSDHASMSIWCALAEGASSIVIICAIQCACASAHVRSGCCGHGAHSQRHYLLHCRKAKWRRTLMMSDVRAVGPGKGKLSGV